MRILVTGGTGFLGSYVVEDLIRRGHDVSVLIRPGSDRWRLAQRGDGFRPIPGTIEDVAALRAPLSALGLDAAVHLAWEGVSNDNRNSPLQARNVAYSVELAALAAELGIGVFVGTGSQAEYGPYQRPICEEDATRPTTLYGHAKLAAGTMARHVAAEKGMRFAWLRVFSTYGPRDHDHWLIPDLIRKLKSRQRMSLTACEQLWGFLHARDAAAAFSTVLENPSANGIFNVGSDSAPPLRDTVSKIRDLVDPTAVLGFGDIPYRPDQVMILLADIRRLRSLGWQPSVELTAGLQETVAFYDATKFS